MRTGDGETTQTGSGAGAANPVGGRDDPERRFAWSAAPEMLGWIENRRPRLPVSGEAAAIADLDQTFRQLGAEARHLPPDDSRRVRCLNLVTEAESSLPLARGYVSRARRVLADATDVGDRLVGGWEVNP